MFVIVGVTVAVSVSVAVVVVVALTMTVDVVTLLEVTVVLVVVVEVTLCVVVVVLPGFGQQVRSNIRSQRRAKTTYTGHGVTVARRKEEQSAEPCALPGAADEATTWMI